MCLHTSSLMQACHMFRPTYVNRVRRCAGGGLANKEFMPCNENDNCLCSINTALFISLVSSLCWLHRHYFDATSMELGASRFYNN